jgi:lipopolysaccharide heptosyltransferase II
MHSTARLQATSQPQRILAVKLADLGDLLTVTPALQALRAAHTAAQIDLLVPPSSAHLLKGSPFLDEIVTFDKFAFDSLRGLLDIRSLASTLRFLFRLRGRRYDTLVLFHHFTTRWGTAKFAALSMASGARTRAGLDNGRGSFLTHRASDQGFGAKHEADYWLDVASLAGANGSAGWRPVLPVSDKDREMAATLLKDIRKSTDVPLVAIHPGAGAYSPARIWPTEEFAAAARGLMDSHDAAIILLGGPDEMEKARHLEQLIGQSGRVLNLAGRTSIHQTAVVIEGCDLFVGNDSGPMHVAAAMNTPVVAIFGPSNHQAWGPYTPSGEKSIHTIVSRDLPCQPCFYRAHSLGLREGCGPRPCLTGLGHERVLEACKRVLDEEQ